MDRACDLIMNDYRAMVYQWVAAKVIQTGLEPRRVWEFISGL